MQPYQWRYISKGHGYGFLHKIDEHAYVYFLPLLSSPPLPPPLSSLTHPPFPLLSSSLSSVTGPQQVVLVIQSQRNSYHSRQASQRKEEILLQATQLGQGAPVVLLLHELSQNDGDWSILPALPHLSVSFSQSAAWFMFVEEETSIMLTSLLRVLNKYDAQKEWFLGKRLHDSKASIIHHYAFSEDPTSFGYPDPAAGWVLSAPLLHRLAERIQYSPLKSDFTIDLKHEIALYIWDDGRGPVLTDVPEFCAGQEAHCATAFTASVPNCDQSQLHGNCRYAGVVGAIDGTHIKIIAPSKDEDVFVNRKKLHSINTQIVFDATFNILDVVAKWPGSTHDSRILMESGLRQDVALDTLSQSTTGSS
ncbi:Beta-1,3-glucosyltransferase [Merluccius polli]|uniref:Beta-1,3-glucosyltransferase n=1 Tax=Merluccius polli TaxID=89951 RepID=A0AA47M7S0_MERPO|nr:Beta-1,3-glucosyltransferase [Merluccius polli]